MLTLTNHWVDQARKVPSPNFNARPDPEDISLVVIHNISL
ncbi:MAG TPA: 1,6-anhydro-N-acetylmuramyl-L-alanine amidase AmpD, partial [Alcanivorax sp.]|nr:1,6-anhydro-N-acetylmuramyl-L-alanine amidase AmpD [Alcanivorax sp.]